MDGEKKSDKEWISSRATRQLLDVTTPTLRNWDKQGKIRSVRTPSKQRLYNLEDIYRIIGRNPSTSQKEKIAYCRVSSKKQLDDLRRQEDFFRRSYPDHKVVTDIGSGINWKRKGLQTILERAMSNELEEVVVAHRDRLCRFAFELVEWILETNKVRLVVLDQETQKSPDEDLANDILSIVHVYSCRAMGRRRYNGCQKNKDLPDSEPGQNIE